MTFSNFIDSLTQRKLWVLIAATVFNCLLYLYYWNWIVFLIRQVFIFFGFIILNTFSDEFIEFFEEKEIITQTLNKNFPLFKSGKFLLSACVLSGFVWLDIDPPYEHGNPISLIFLLSTLYALLTFYRCYCIYQTPEVLVKYNIVQAVERHGFLSFEVLKAFIYCFTEIVKCIFMFFILIWWTPKLFFGADHRSMSIGIISRLFTGVQSYSETTYSRGCRLIKLDSKWKDRITESDGITLSKAKINEAYDSLYKEVSNSIVNDMEL